MGNGARRTDWSSRAVHRAPSVRAVAAAYLLWHVDGMPKKQPQPSPDELLDRLRALCFGLPAAEEKPSHGSPSFFVRGKQFASFTMGYGYGPSAWVKCDLERQAELVAAAPDRYYVPKYVGVKGWVGVILDERTDWERLGVLLEAGWDAVAPKTARDAPILPPPRNSPRLAETDPQLAASLLSKIETIARGLDDGCEVERHDAGATLRAHGKPLCYFNDNHHHDGILSISVRCPFEEAQRLAASARRFYFPSYIAKRGWVAIRLDQGPVDWGEVEAFLSTSLAAVTPARATRSKKQGS